MCVLRLILLLVLASFTYGSSEPEPRIINGTTVDIARHPYMVSLRYRRNAESSYMHECAGIIYNEWSIVTAAQCLHSLSEDTKIIAVVGANTRNASDGIVYPVANWTYHSDFDYYTADYDIGVVLLDTALNFTRTNVKAIGLRAERPATGRLATVAGWGYREEGGQNSYYLEQIQVPIVSMEQCTDIYGVGEVTDRMVCAGDVTNGGKDACQGDTGGPLVIDDQLVGLVSWGRGCGRVGYPTVYTFVTSLKGWIDETLAAAGAL